MSRTNDVKVLRELARQYADLAADPVNDERRRLWRSLHDLQPTRPPVLVNYGMWNVWCREVFGDDSMECEDPFYRGHERSLRMQIFHAGIGDDFILEPWITQGAARTDGWGGLWGLQISRIASQQEGGAWHFDPVIREPEDARKLVAPPHRIDEAATDEMVSKLSDAVGDILTVNVDRCPVCMAFAQDISTHLAQLRGLEQLMLDMYERPEWLHEVLAFMRDGILANQAGAVAAGDVPMTASHNQAMPYGGGVADPRPNDYGHGLNDLWGYVAAQEFTGISPAMHDEFLLQYQLPILAQYGVTHYGCCEDLTRKIDMLRQIPNLRRIAVTPRANLASCAEQIGTDYVISWRPNPTDMVCCGFNRDAILRTLEHGFAVSAGCHLEVTLKDIETVEGQPDRLRQWVELVHDAMARTV